MIVYDNYISSTTAATIQFENANEGISYPFDDNSTLTSDSGKTLNNNVVADMHLVIPVDSTATLSSVYISENMISICIKIVDAHNKVSALSCTVKSSLFKPFIPYRLDELTGCSDSSGVVTFGSFNFQTEQGSYKFSETPVKISDSAVSKYTLAGLRKIIDDRTGESLTGDIDVEFTSYVDAEKDDNGIRLKLRPEAKDTLLSSCSKISNKSTCVSTPISKINNVSPDSSDRIVIWFH